MPQRSFHIAIGILIALFCSGCVSSNIATDYRLDGSTGKGLLVFSFTTDPEADNPYLHYRNKNTGEKGEILRNTFANPLDWESPKGRLVTIELDRGEYEFLNWTILMQGRAGRNFSIPFEIVPGNATYAGNLHLTINPGGNYDVQITDTWDRDIPLLQQRFPNLASTKIIKHISKLQLRPN